MYVIIPRCFTSFVDNCSPLEYLVETQATTQSQVKEVERLHETETSHFLFSVDKHKNLLKPIMQLQDSLALFTSNLPHETQKRRMFMFIIQFPILTLNK